MERLHALSSRLLSANDLVTALDDVLSNAIASCEADFGNVQLVNARNNSLEIVAQRGFDNDFLDHFRAVRIDDGSVCARAMKAARPHRRRGRGARPRVRAASRHGRRAGLSRRAIDPADGPWRHRRRHAVHSFPHPAPALRAGRTTARSVRPPRRRLVGACTVRTSPQGRRPAQGRIPGDAGPRTAQPAGSDPQRSGDHGCSWIVVRAGREGQADHRTSGAPPGAAGRRPDGCLAHHAGQGAAAQRAGVVAERAQGSHRRGGSDDSRGQPRAAQRAAA